MTTIAGNNELIKQYYGLEPSQVKGTVLQSYKPAGLSLYGFSTEDIRNYLFDPSSGTFGLAEAESIQRASLGMKQTDSTILAALTIDPARLKEGAGSYNWGWGDIPWGIQHLSEHPKGSHYGGDFSFNPIKAISRLFTITPQSFTPGNLIRSLSSATTTTLTGGLGSAIHPGGTAIAPTGAHDAGPLQSAFVGANSFGVTRASPNKPESFLDKLARIVGGAVSAIAVGSAAKAIAAKPTGTAGVVNSGVAGTGASQGSLTFGQSVGNLGLAGVSTAAYTTGFGSLVQTFVGVFGNVGRGLVQLVSGDVTGAVQSFTTNPPSPNTAQQSSVFYNSYGGSSGGGGGGVNFGSGQSSQSTTNILMYGILGIMLLVVVVKMMKRK